MRRVLVGVAIVVVAVTGLFAGYVAVTNRPLPQNEHDIAILKRSLELLDSPGRWSKSDDRSCDPAETELSLYCVLKQASLEVSGEFRHRSAAMQQVRYSIEEAMRTRDYAHRLMDFNNDPLVTLDDVHRVLRISIAALEQSGVPTP